jgi:hypothetical protein
MILKALHPGRGVNARPAALVDPGSRHGLN